MQASISYVYHSIKRDPEIRSRTRVFLQLAISIHKFMEHIISTRRVLAVVNQSSVGPLPVYMK